MRTTIYLTILLAIFAATASAQKGKAAPLPASIANFSVTGQDSDTLLKNKSIRSRLKKLLGNKNFASFIESFETLAPVQRNGNTLFVSGCLIHACTHLESALVIDVNANTIHAAIYNEETPTRYFNERGSPTPAAISKWANHLIDINTQKN